MIGRRAAIHRLGEWTALLLLCGVAIAPLLRLQSPCTHDGSLHYYRVAAMRHALGEGALFSRWLSGLAFGYGQPFFNFREPLSYYLTLAIHLTGFSLPLALNLVYVASIVGSAIGAYLLGQDLFGRAAGMAAGIAYAYAPYQLLDALARGNAPESVALALLPFTLWAFRRLALQGGRRWFLASTGLLAAQYLDHHISSLLFTPLLLAYLALLAAVHRRRFQWLQVALAVTLALGATAFLWLPALAEKDMVQLYLTRATRNNDYHYNFLGLAEILAPPAPADNSLMNPPLRVTLGLVPVLLAALGLLAGLWRTQRSTDGTGRERRATLLFLAIAATAMVALSTRASLALWERVPLLPFVQFPWRLIGRAALPVSLLAGAALPPTSTESPRGPGPARLAALVSTPVVVGALVLAAIPTTYPPLGYCAAAPYPTISDVHRFEHESRLVGVDPVGAYFPVWVQERPDGSPLEELYATVEPVARFDASALPDHASIAEATYGPQWARIVVDSPQEFRARYLAFYFPGWEVRVDDHPVQAEPSDPEGLLTFMVPAGRHTVSVRFGETPLRQAADLLSLFSLAGVLALALKPFAQPRPAQSGLSRAASPSDTSAPVWALTALGVLLLPLKLLVIDRADTLFRRPSLQAGGTLPGIAAEARQRYADGLVLIGAELATGRMPADGTLRVDLYWTADGEPQRDYQTTLHLEGPDGLLWSNRDSARPRGYHPPPPTTAWEPGQYALDSHEVDPLSGAPPGTYRVVLTVFDRDTLAPLSWLTDGGQLAAPTLTLGEIVLTRPARRATAPAEGRVEVAVGPYTVLSARLDRSLAASGDPVYLTLWWRADEELDGRSPSPAAALVLLAPDGSAVATTSLPSPAVASHPGDVWRSQHRLALPADLPSATYTWELRASPEGGPGAILSDLTISAPERTFLPPPFAAPVGVTLEGIATLVGATIEPADAPLAPGAPLRVTLVWRAEGTASVSHHVFVHLLGADGRLVAQSDGVPAGWTRPTTGWLAGEYITDVHVLTLPDDTAAGQLTLQAGLYVPGGPRLTDAEGHDAVWLAAVDVTAP